MRFCVKNYKMKYFNLLIISALLFLREALCVCPAGQSDLDNVCCIDDSTGTSTILALS